MPKRSDERMQFLRDLASTGIEGGIGYWSYTNNYDCDTDDVIATISPNIGTDGDFEPTDLTIDSLASALDKVIKRKVKFPEIDRAILAKASRHNDDVDSEIDASTADMLIQVAILGETVYG